MKPQAAPANFHPALRCFFPRVALALLIAGPMAAAAIALDFAVLTKSVESERAARYAVFRDFQIKGFCGTARLDLASAYGANTIRTYTPPTRAELDEYQRLGFKVIVGIWMPHHGPNSGKDGKWSYDYNVRGDDQLKSLMEAVERIGDHPAILLWCLGNEVHLEQPYLETVNRMSEALHKRYPKQLTSLTMINAPKEKVELIKQCAPDLDVIGFNSYGHGAVGGGSRVLEEVWGRGYYVSEFGPQGPWWGRKTAWGVFYEQSYDAKLNDLRQSFAKIDAAPRCLGSTMFLWGYWSANELPTYFSAFLSPQLEAKKGIPDDQLLLTPMGDEFCRYWSGQYPKERAPILGRIQVAGVPEKSDVVVKAGAHLTVTATANDPDSPTTKLKYRWWILAKGGKPVAGPVDSDRPTAELAVPSAQGEHFFLLGLVMDPSNRASGFTLPIRTE
jgi:hypothetical protein